MLIRVYIDTSVIGGLLDAEFREHTERLFRDFGLSRFQAVISDLTVMEVNKAGSEIRNLMKLPALEKAERIELDEAAVKLSERYLAEKIVGREHRVDALHIALATIKQVDILASWNFKHIVKWSKIRAYNAVNRKSGYSLLDIRSPREIYYEKEEDI
jgi:hypothetical protein